MTTNLVETGGCVDIYELHFILDEPSYDIFTSVLNETPCMTCTKVHYITKPKRDKTNWVTTAPAKQKCVNVLTYTLHGHQPEEIKQEIFTIGILPDSVRLCDCAKYHSKHTKPVTMTFKACKFIETLSSVTRAQHYYPDIDPTPITHYIETYKQKYLTHTPL